MLKIFKKCCGSEEAKDSNCFSILALISLVVLLVVGVMYATYIFIEATGISNIAGVHVSKNIFLATKSAQGKLYSNEEKGIKDWIIYKDAAAGFVVKYPNDLEEGRTLDNELEFKKTNQSASSRNQLLLFSIVVGEDTNENLNDIDFIKNKYPEWDGKLQRDILGEKEGLRTGVFKSASGIYKELVFWNMGKRRIYIESRCYSENMGEHTDIFNKVISEFNIL
ncbi:MAG: hypothetical protein ACD_9C00205G0006 [uncultured bacterium]|nr:MAG: hypothetical protein ACD_9C00205G0006 [uncultured bacterium]